MGTREILDKSRWKVQDVRWRKRKSFSREVVDMFHEVKGEIINVEWMDSII